jgi:predicted NBD/HSP70 family sugar kinase
MYICIDIGGTKTLVASVTSEGAVKESVKFPTPEEYEHFLPELQEAVENLSTDDFRAGTVAVPGAIDRKHGRLIQLGNRASWKNIHILRDIESITHCPMLIENDAKLAGLSEAMLLKRQYSRVLYVTMSTGIGIGLTVNGQLDPNIGDGGGRSMLLSHNNTLTPWEEFASGKAVVKKYGKMASEIDDEKIWEAIARNLTPGLIELVAILNPEAIVIGGGAGHHLGKRLHVLIDDMKKYETPLLQIPPILAAQRPDEAVIYGCYDYARQHHA